MDAQPAWTPPKPDLITGAVPVNYSPDCSSKKCACSTCKRRGQYLSFDQFGKDKLVPGGLSSYCLECKSNSMTMSRYGKTNDEIDQMYIDQNGLCLISGLPIYKEDKSMVIDHVAGTKKVRGLIHTVLNMAMGLFDHNPFWLVSAADHIINHLDRVPKGLTAFIRKWLYKLESREQAEQSEPTQLDLFNN